MNQKLKSQPDKNTPQSDPDSDATTELQRIVSVAESGQLGQALKLTTESRHNTDAIRNARGVCLLRIGRINEALNLYRSFVLPSGCTWMKPELPIEYRVNFCTSLLLTGHPIGCCDCLGEIENQQHPAVVRLRGVIVNWEGRMSWGQRMLWRIGVVPDLPIESDFVPGEFDRISTHSRTSVLDSRLAS